MKNLARFLFFLALVSVPIFAQGGPGQGNYPGVLYVSNAPSGACTNGTPIQVVIPTGVLYSCQGGTWAQISGTGGSPGGSNYSTQYNNGGAFGGYGPGIIGQSEIAQGPAAPPIFASPAVLDSTSSPVSTTPYTLQCDSSTTILDRAATLRFQSGAAAVTVPLSSASGCSGLFVSVMDDGAGTLTFSPTGSDTFSVFNGSTNSDGATSFTMTNGQWATLSQSAAGIWEARIVTGGSSGAVSSVSNSDSTLTISPTTGAVVASLNLGHANTWTAAQTFPGATFAGAVTISGQLLATEPTGSVWGSATGGAKGAGTINAAGLYVNGSAVGTSSGTVTSSGYSSGTPLAAFSTSTNITPATSSNVIALFGSGSCSGYLKSDGTCSTPSTTVYTLQVAGSGLTAGDTVNFNATTPAAGSNGVNVTFQTSKASTTDSVSAEIVGDGTSTHYLSGVGTWTTPAGSGGTVTGCSFTGGLISCSGSTTAASTVAGTSGGIPYFSSGTTWASSGALTQYGVVLGGGGGNTPTSTAAGTATYPLVANTSAAPTFQQLTGAGMANATVTATQLAAQYSKGSCTEVWGGTGTSNVLTAGDDAISNNTCYNDSGVTRTITAVKCRSDYSSNTTTVNPSFGSAGTGTTVCSGTLQCGNSYAYSSSCSVSNASWTTGTGIDPVMGTPDTHSTSLAVIIEYTY
jgi:hypothetical protein